LSLDGTENNYSKYIYKKYKHLKNIIFLGELSRLEVFDYYIKSDCLLFPSKLETWGLPLSEFKNFNKPILASNLPYAKETIGLYDKIKYFNHSNHKELASYMEDIINNTIVYDETRVHKYDFPYADNWQELFDKIFI
jgi:glycosyltransferase involved in cell wall biosynthesis